MYRRYFLALLAWLVVASAIAADRNTTSEATNRFWFAQISDTHFGADDWLNRLERVVKAINAHNQSLEFVLHTGDVTQDCIEDESVVRQGKEVLAKLKAPLYLVPGNHDILRTNTGPTVTAFRAQFGELGHMHEHRGVQIICVSTEPLAQPVPVEELTPLKWVEERLHQLGEKPVLLATHAPFTTGLYPEPVRQRWIRLVNRFNVKGVFSGHVHTDSLVWLGSVPNFTSGHVAGKPGRAPSFRVYEYADGRLSFVTRYLD